MTLSKRSKLFMVPKVLYLSIIGGYWWRIPSRSGCFLHSKFIFRRHVISLLSVSRENKICAYLAPWDLWSQASRLSTAAQQQATHISLCLHQWSKIWTEQKYIHSVQLLLYTPTLLYTITLAYVFNAKRFTNYKSIIIHLTYVKEKDLLTPRKCIDLATLKSTSLQAPFTLVRFRFKTHNFCYSYAYRLHYSGILKVENRDFFKCCRPRFSLKTPGLCFSVIDQNGDFWKWWRGCPHSLCVSLMTV